MKRTLALLLVCALGLGLLAGCSTGTDESLGPGCDGFPAAPPSQPWSNAEKLSVSPKGSEAVNEALASFGLKLLQKTREADKQSPLVSPQYLSDYQGLLGSSQCRIANSLWKDHSGGIYEDFVSKCRGYYSAQVYEAELSEPRIVDDLNGWVSDKTNKMIPQIIDQPFPEETACLLVNALYLKNSWLSEFDPLSTHTMDFHHAGGPDSQVEYLRKFDTQLSYLQGKGAQGVVLPYDDGRLAFVAILPDLYPDSPDLGQWLNNLEGNSLSQLIINREDALFVSFAMPKFTAEWSGSLTDILSELGLEDAFDAARADFSNLGDSPEGYYISQVIHATKIEVNEKGTEAAAATVVAAESGAAAPPQEGITLILDRPFLYGIVDLYTGVPRFLGTYE